jgi:hypothetical protein
MVGIINAFIDICLFRTGPQHLPASRALLSIVVVCNLLAGTLMLKVSTPVVQAFMMAVVDTVLLFILANVALQLRSHTERALQTLIALIGTSTLMSLIAWPVSAWFNSATAAGADAGLPSLIILLMLFWNIGIIGHILRHALGISLASGIGLSVLYVFLAIYISAILFPA